MVRVLSVLVSVVVMLAAVTGSIAQVTTATFYGNVTDVSGAVLPGVTVTLVHQGTSATFTKLTDETGEFTFTFLAAGNYTVTLELPGFKTHVSTDFSLGAAQNVRRTFTLEVGGVSEKVTVTGEAPLVNTVSAQQRSDYSTMQVNELPLQNRDFTSLFNSSASVSSSSHQALTKPPLRPDGPPPQMSCSSRTTSSSGARSLSWRAVHSPV